MIFGKRAAKKGFSYDKNGKTPVIQASICTGEKVAGFKNDTTGKFEDLMVIRNDADLKRFMRIYGVEEGEIRKEW